MNYDKERTSCVPCAVKDCRFYNTSMEQCCDCVGVRDDEPFLSKCERYMPDQTDGLIAARARIAELEQERDGLLAVVLKAVADEPECPDPMPDGMWMAMAEHKDVAEEAVRIAVRQTKAGIHDRIVKATSPAQAGKGEGTK